MTRYPLSDVRKGRLTWGPGSTTRGTGGRHFVRGGLAGATRLLAGRDRVSFARGHLSVGEHGVDLPRLAARPTYPHLVLLGRRTDRGRKAGPLDVVAS
jgi:hypothetical protein